MKGGLIQSRSYRVEQPFHISYCSFCMTLSAQCLLPCGFFGFTDHMFLHNRLFCLLKRVNAKSGKYFVCDDLAVYFRSEAGIQALNYCLSNLGIKMAG